LILLLKTIAKLFFDDASHTVTTGLSRQAVVILPGTGFRRGTNYFYFRIAIFGKGI
jgi:hypothetical protein